MIYLWYEIDIKYCLFFLQILIIVCFNKFWFSQICLICKFSIKSNFPNNHKIKTQTHAKYEVQIKTIYSNIQIYGIIFRMYNYKTSNLYNLYQSILYFLYWNWISFIITIFFLFTKERKKTFEAKRVSISQFDIDDF